MLSGFQCTSLGMTISNCLEYILFQSLEVMPKLAVWLVVLFMICDSYYILQHCASHGSMYCSATKTWKHLLWVMCRPHVGGDCVTSIFKESLACSKAPEVQLFVRLQTVFNQIVNLDISFAVSDLDELPSVLQQLCSTFFQDVRDHKDVSTWWLQGVYGSYVILFAWQYLSVPLM